MLLRKSVYVIYCREALNFQKEREKKLDSPGKRENYMLKRQIAPRDKYEIIKELFNDESPAAARTPREGRSYFPNEEELIHFS